MDYGLVQSPNHLETLDHEHIRIFFNHLLHFLQGVIAKWLDYHPHFLQRVTAKKVDLTFTFFGCCTASASHPEIQRQ